MFEVMQTLRPFSETRENAFRLFRVERKSSDKFKNIRFAIDRWLSFPLVCPCFIPFQKTWPNPTSKPVLLF